MAGFKDREKMLMLSMMPMIEEHIDELCADMKRQQDEGIADYAMLAMYLAPEGTPAYDKASVFAKQYRAFKEKLDAIPGTPPNMIYPPVGDAFAARSKYAMEIDYKAQPPFFKVSDTHYAATWLLHPNAPKVEMPKIVSERIKNATEGGK